MSKYAELIQRIVNRHIELFKGCEDEEEIKSSLEHILSEYEDERAKLE